MSSGREKEAGEVACMKNLVPDQIAQGDNFLHLAIEANRHRFLHIEGHEARDGKVDQT